MLDREFFVRPERHRLGRKGVRKNANLRNSRYIHFRHECLTLPPPKKANKQINKNDIGNQAKIREVDKKYKMFANPVFITWGRRSQWRKCLKINCKIKRDLPVSWSLNEILSSHQLHQGITWDCLAHAQHQYSQPKCEYWCCACARQSHVIPWFVMVWL